MLRRHHVGAICTSNEIESVGPFQIPTCMLDSGGVSCSFRLLSLGNKNNGNADNSLGHLQCHGVNRWKICGL